MARRTTARLKHRTRGAPVAPVSAAALDTRIYELRGLKVMLDSDLAEFYGVTTKRLNEQVRRNAHRFPADFAFQATLTEYEQLRSQIATLRSAPDAPAHGRHRKYPPYVFTEHGALMAAAVLNSKRAVEMSVLVVRAFVRLRQILVNHEELARRLEKLEAEFVARTDAHETHLHKIYEILAELMNPPAPPPKRRIGFVSE
jgi:phage regulator Rha-like protein